MSMKIVVATDHRGYALKEEVLLLLDELGHEVIYLGTDNPKSCDYPDTAYPAAKHVADGNVHRGILICGRGIGMSICANKVPGIRDALCHDELTAELSRRHTNANILCLASDMLGEKVMRRIVTSWLNTEFESGGRHERRVKKISFIEQGKNPANAFYQSEAPAVGYDNRPVLKIGRESRI